MKFPLFAALFALLAPISAEPATIIRRDINIKLSAQGSIEHQFLEVRLEERGDLEAWKSYSIFVDEHIKLDSASIGIRSATGEKKDSIGTRDFERETSVGSGLHSSTARLAADLTGLSIGDRLSIETTLVKTPLYKAGWKSLLLDSPQETLRIRISGAPEKLRWSLHGKQEGIEIHEAGGEVSLEGHNLPRSDPPERSGNLLSAGPALLWAWDAADTWPAIGAWYGHLTRSESPPTESLRQKALGLTRGKETRREKMLAIAEFVKTSIRYEAVEIGVGGWIPSPAEEVLKRGWGDCKDKAEMLKRLLEVVDISSHLVLVHSGLRGNTDPTFPSTLGFNHCILGVEAGQIETTEGDPVVEGFFFLDPTMDLGPADWFNPANQGQWALVSTEPGRLLPLPSQYQREGWVLNIEGAIDSSGSFQGRGVLQLVGSRALPWLRSLKSEAPERIDEAIRNFLQNALPGMAFGRLSWTRVDREIPTIRFDLEVSQPGFLRTGRHYRVRLAFLGTLPGARELEDRTAPVVLLPGLNRTQWRISLPEGVCIPDVQPSEFSNSIGTLAKGPGKDKGLLSINHQIVVRRAWIGAESLAPLRKLAAAEEKAQRAVLRWNCGEQ